MLRKQTFTRRKNTDLNGSLLQVQHATFLTQQWTGLHCFTQSVAALYNSFSNEYSRIHLPEDTFLLLEDEAAVPDCQSGCFVSRGGRPSWLSSTPCSSTFDVLSHRSERLLHFQAVLWAQTGMQKPRVYLKRDWASLLSCHRAVLHLCKCYFFPAAHS